MPEAWQYSAGIPDRAAPDEDEEQTKNAWRRRVTRRAHPTRIRLHVLRLAPQVASFILLNLMNLNARRGPKTTPAPGQVIVGYQVVPPEVSAVSHSLQPSAAALCCCSAAKA